jgi:hypothetical protein
MFTFTKETLDNTNYFSTTNARGTVTTMFKMGCTVFVQVNRSPAKAIQDIAKLSKDVKNLISVFEA